MDDIYDDVQANPLLREFMLHPGSEFILHPNSELMGQPPDDPLQKSLNIKDLETVRPLKSQGCTSIHHY